MPLTANPQTAWVFDHDSTWDYVCRNCMRNGETVNMEAYEDYSGVWIKCPKCGIIERIDLNDLWESAMRKNFFHLEK